MSNPYQENSNPESIEKFQLKNSNEIQFWKSIVTQWIGYIGPEKAYQYADDAILAYRGRIESLFGRQNLPDILNGGL